jgi:hypothetical protein
MKTQIRKKNLIKIHINISSKFNKTSSQWATPGINLILTKPDLAAHDTVNENPNPDFKNIIQILAKLVPSHSLSIQLSKTH